MKNNRESVDENSITETKFQQDLKLSFTQEVNAFLATLKWKVLTRFILVHCFGIYGLITFPYLTHKLTSFWVLIVYVYTIFGTTAGAHRYWVHRSYKANLPLRLILAFTYYSAGVFKIRDWVKTHRVHHKYTDMDADPYNSTRGFFYAHCGWYLTKRHPEYYKRLKEVDLSDIDADPIASFGDKHFNITGLILAVIFPIFLPMYLWNENWYYALISQLGMRYILVINSTSLINSAAHIYGSKPYNKPSENLLVSILAAGEGWHNFHHTFPWDYRAGEFSEFYLNFATFGINQFAKIGWAYDLKTASKKLIDETVKKRGDGSYENLWEEVPEQK